MERHPYSDDPDVQLMLAFQAGDTDAFAELFSRNKDRLHRFIYRYIPEKDQAEELIQETFLRVFHARETYHPGAAFTTWLFQIATYLCLNHKRSERRMVSLDEPSGSTDEAPELTESAASPHQTLLNEQQSDAILKAIQELPEHQRAIALLVCYEDMPLVQAAEIIGITAVGARLRWMRARSTLKRKLAHLTETLQPPQDSTKEQP